MEKMLAVLLIAAAGLSGRAVAQTTDGYHSIQVFPVVVDSASFVQRFNFTTPNGYPVELHATYVPGNGTAQAAVGTVVCLPVTIPANSSVAVASLRQFCPGLVAGSAFGFLHIQSAPSSDGLYNDIPVFAAFSRVSNIAGAGFTVESFAAHTFTSANTVVTGLRRSAATAGSPAYQSNCFLGNLNEVTPSQVPVAKRVNYTVYTQAGAYGAYVDLLPGQLVRLLDVFAAAGAPAGDYDNANAVFIADGGLAATNRPGLLTFCTVQDNTSFGADFRIGKTSYGTFGIGSNDSTTAREILAEKDLLGRNFEIDAGQSANTHLVYFRHPDTVKCELLQKGSPWPRLTPAAGLEIRVLNRKGAVIGGGSDSVSTGPMYLGDKSDTPGAYNDSYTIEVESNEQNTGVVRPYALYCASGSGNTAGYELLRYKEAIDRF